MSQTRHGGLDCRPHGNARALNFGSVLQDLTCLPGATAVARRRGNLSMRGLRLGLLLAGTAVAVVLLVPAYAATDNEAIEASVPVPNTAQVPPPTAKDVTAPTAATTTSAPAVTTTTGTAMPAAQPAATQSNQPVAAPVAQPV